MLSAHLTSLERKHARLEARIHEEMTHSSGNDFLVEKMKREKLHIREEIEFLRRKAG